MTAMSQAPLLPRLRFPEFRDAPEWSASRGNALFDSINNRGAAPGLPVLAVTQEHGAIPRDQIDYHVSVTAESVASYKEVCEGDFIISLRSFQGGIEYSRYHGICSPAYVVLRRKGDGHDDFFRHLFKSDRFIRQLTRNIEGLRDGKMISFAQFSEQLLPVPEPAEQLKVAACLDSLDDLIAAERRKLETLQEYKRGLARQLFPLPGETVPRLRFPEFGSDGEWRDGLLKDFVGSIRTGKLDANAMVEGGKYRFYTCAKDYYWIDEYAFDGEALLIAGNGAYLGYIHHYIGKFNAYQRTYVLQDFRIHVPFLKAFLDRNLPARIQAEKKDGNTPYIVLATIAEMPLLVPPTAAEQERVAAFLLPLDEVLAAQAQKIEGLKVQKKGLVQQLLPSLEEGAQ